MFAFDTLLHRVKRGCETMGYPKAPPPALPDRHGGALRVDAARCTDGCRECVDVCPTGAITRPGKQPIALDLGKCIFCQACITACPPGVITHTNDHRMAVRNREDLLLGAPGQEEVRLAAALDDKLRKLFGRSLRLRVVSAGGCGGCEADVNVLNTIG
jgi:formate hydrogenlyase subunit 6/NADH:ubiquinone oxidoreductase subunit I